MVLRSPYQRFSTTSMKLVFALLVFMAPPAGGQQAGGGGADDNQDDDHEEEVLDEAAPQEEKVIRRNIKTAKSRITRLFNGQRTWFDGRQAAALSISSLEDHIEKVRHAAEDLASSLRAFAELPHVTDQQYEKVEGGATGVQAYLETADEAVAAALARIDNLQGERIRVNDQAAVNTFASTLQHTAAKLPQLSIKPFSGDYSDWGRFHLQFGSAVVSRKTLTDDDKFNYLTHFLQGEAKSKVAGLLAGGCSFHEAYQLLADRYGHVRLTVSRIITQIVNRPKMKNDKDLGALVDDLRAKHRLLVSLSSEFEAEGANFLFQSLFEAKLSDDLREKWEHKVMNEEQKRGHDPSHFQLVLPVSDFFRFLDVIVMSREALTRNKTDKDKSESKGKSDQVNVAVNSAPDGGAKGGKGSGNKGGNKSGKSGSGGKSGNGGTGGDGSNKGGKSGGASPRDCLFCGAKNHRTPKCTSVDQLNTNQRWDKIRYKCCYRCLLPRNEEGHPNAGCTFESRCGTQGCDRFHHPLLHREGEQPQQD